MKKPLLKLFDLHLHASKFDFQTNLAERLLHRSLTEQ